MSVVAEWTDTVSVEQVRRMCRTDPNPFVRPAAIRSLTTLLGEEALPDLLGFVRDPNMAVVRAAIQSLGALPSLTGQAVAELSQIRDDDRVGGLVKSVLEKNGLRMIAAPEEPDALAERPPRHASGLPADLLSEAPALLAALERWQAALGGPSQLSTLAQHTDIDRALSALILALRQPRGDEASE